MSSTDVANAKEILNSAELIVPSSPMSSRSASPRRCARSAQGPPVQTATQGKPASAAIDMKASPTTQVTLGAPGAAARAASSACLSRQLPRPPRTTPSGAMPATHRCPLHPSGPPRSASCPGRPRRIAARWRQR